METSVKLHLTVRSLISSSFATCGKELLLTCASSGNREEWIHSSRALAAPLPKLYPEPVQVSMLAGIVQAACLLFHEGITKVSVQPSYTHKRAQLPYNCSLWIPCYHFKSFQKIDENRLFSHHRRQLWNCLVGSKIKTPDMRKRLKPAIKYMKMHPLPGSLAITSLTYTATLLFSKHIFHVIIISWNKQTDLLLRKVQELIDHIWSNSKG